jgi:hypothetical protein
MICTSRPSLHRLSYLFIQSEGDNDEDDDEEEEDGQIDPNFVPVGSTVSSPGDTGRQGFLWREVDPQFSTTFMETHQKVNYPSLLFVHVFHIIVLSFERLC